VSIYSEAKYYTGLPRDFSEPCNGHVQGLNGTPVRLLVRLIGLWAAALGGFRYDPWKA